MKILYEAVATSHGGRTGEAKSSDGNLAVKLVTPKEMGGPGGEGPNPEQLFAAGYSACFLSALKLVAGQQKQKLPEDAAITAHVRIGPNDKGEGYNLDITLEISLPGVEHDVADKLVEQTHKVCPYSNATRGNVNVELKLA